MTDTTWPILETPVSETQWRALLSGLDDGVLAGPGSTSLQVSADDTGMIVTVAAGLASVQGFGFNRDAADVVTIAAANTQPRIDAVVLRYTPGVGVVLAVVAGAPVASPTKPALTQDSGGVWETPLAYVTVPANASSILASNVAEGRRFAGHNVSPCISTDRPTATAGLVIYETDTGRMLVWSGTTWVVVYDPPSFVDVRLAASKSTSSNVKLGFSIALLAGGFTATDIVSGVPTILNVPATARYNVRGMVRGDNNGTVEIRRNGAAIIAPAFPSTGAGDVRSAGFTRTLTLASGDEITVYGVAGDGTLTISVLELTIERA